MPIARRPDMKRRPPKPDPAPVDLGSESVAGEEDPGASIDAGTDERPVPPATGEAESTRPADAPPPAARRPPPG